MAAYLSCCLILPIRICNSSGDTKIPSFLVAATFLPFALTTLFFGDASCFSFLGLDFAEDGFSAASTTGSAAAGLLAPAFLVETDFLTGSYFLMVVEISLFFPTFKVFLTMTA